LLQNELFDEVAASRCGLPTALNMLAAKDFLQVRDRARGNLPLPDFARIAHIERAGSSNDKTFAIMKAALLAIEAALPLGSVDNTGKGPWRPDFAQQWRLMVQKAKGPAKLMRCTILLEDIISDEWMKEDVGHLRSCLPSRWKALGEASASGLAVRIILLDRAIMYGTVDRKRFSSKKRK